jgi:hypothetical protein
MARQLTGKRAYLKGLACVAAFGGRPLDSAAADLDPRTASAYDRYIEAAGAHEPGSTAADPAASESTRSRSSNAGPVASLPLSTCRGTSHSDPALQPVVHVLQ